MRPEGPTIAYPAPLRNLIDLYSEWGFKLLDSEIVIDVDVFLWKNFWVPKASRLRLIAYGQGYHPKIPIRGLRIVNIHSHGRIGCKPSQSDQETIIRLAPPPSKGRDILAPRLRRVACIQCTSGKGLACYTGTVMVDEDAIVVEEESEATQEYALAPAPTVRLDYIAGRGVALVIYGTRPLGGDVHDWVYVVEVAERLGRGKLLVEKVFDCRGSVGGMVSCRTTRSIVEVKKKAYEYRIVELKVEEVKDREAELAAYLGILHLLPQVEGGGGAL